MPKIVTTEDKMKRRMKILEATLKVMNDEKKFKLEAVGKQAGIVRTAIYQYYNSVEELKHDVIRNINNMKDKAEVARYLINNTKIDKKKYLEIYKILTGEE
jgi:AcrR family transcriptional regulator